MFKVVARGTDVKNKSAFQRDKAIRCSELYQLYNTATQGIEKHQINRRKDVNRVKVEGEGQKRNLG